MYFLMLVNRLTKYIELDTVELQDINFLSEMPDKTEKGELNCSLCHTLSHIFGLSRACQQEKTVQTLVLKQIYKILMMRKFDVYLQ